MQIRVIFWTLFLTIISDGFCGRLDNLQNAIKNACPQPEEIPKCDCRLALGGLYVMCKGPMADSEFQSILKTLQEYSLETFRIINYNASSISNDLWKDQNIENLELYNVDVDDTSFRKIKRHFQGLENSLKHLTIENSFKTAHRPPLNLQLDHLKKLEAVWFKNNNIPEVGNDWFTSSPKELLHLSFENNGIKELGDEAFTSLSMLRYLHVAGNDFSLVSRSMFPKSATFLALLDLSNNKLRTLPHDVFSGMPALQVLLLENNRIHTIEEDTWKSVAPQFRLVTLRGNPLQCDEKIKWICNTNLRRRTLGSECSSPLNTRGWNFLEFCRREDEFIQRRIN